MFWKILLGIIGLILLIAPIWYAIEIIIDEVELYSKRTKISFGATLFILLVLYFIAGLGYGLLTFFLIAAGILFLFGAGIYIREESDDSALRILGGILIFKASALVLIFIGFPFMCLAPDIDMIEMWTNP